MTTSSIEKPRVLQLLAAVLALGCSADPALVPPVEPSLTIALAVDTRNAEPGDTITVQVIAEVVPGVRLGSLQGWIGFDPGALRYLGQPLAGDAPVIVNHGEGDRGHVRLVTLRLQGLPEAVAEFRFLVRRVDYLDQLRFETEEAATSDLRLVHPVATAPLALRPATFPGRVGRPTIADWAAHLGYSTDPALRLPGEGTIYGDVTLGGGINGLDVLAVLNVAVANLSVLTDATKDMVIAGNVAPFNLPGLGEAGDNIPPGRNANGTYDISGLDGLALANEGVGNDQPVVGQPIPGRTPRPGHVVLPSLLDSSRTLYRDTVYELQGNVIVGPGATLTAEPGTRIEGDAATRGALIIARAGNLVLRGTRIEPIVLSCTSATPAAGCWGGVVINGLALLNHSDPGTTGFCPEKFSIGSTELYGGCLVEDTTGVLQYVRIEYAGRSAGSGPTPGLALLGIGSGTSVDQVQVHASLGDGLYLSGGNVNLRHIVLTGNAGAGLHWDHGWGGNATGGNAQFVQIQVPANGGDGVIGSNLLGNPDAGPRSEPKLYNLTVVGDSVGVGRGIVWRDGSAGVVRNSIVLRPAGAGFEVDGAASCSQFSAGFAFFDHNITFQGDPDFSGDSDCLDEAAYAAEPALANRTIDPGLRAPFNTLSPDTRPLLGGPPASGAVAPPQNFFFDITVTYIGAVPVSNLLGTDIPWYAGWTRGWAGMVP